MNKNQKSVRSAYFGIVLGICLIMGYLEAILPLNLGVAGAKLGITNFVILLVLKRDGLKPALALNLARILIINILFGNALAVFYSLPGGVASTLLMYFLLKIPTLSSIGVSAAGGAVHNLLQLISASIILKTPSVLSLAPPLLILGMAAGIFCGILTELIYKRLQKANL